MKKILKLILFLFVVNMIGIVNVLAVTNPYKEQGPYGTNCTWYAWKKAYEKSGMKLPGWGNAKEWYNNAKNDGYSVGTTPKSNSIIMWGSWTKYGHVGYVEKVDGNIMYIWDSSMSCIDREDPEFQECMANGVSEESDKICYANAKKIACEYTISPDEFGITGYIYLDIAPKLNSTKEDKNSKKESTITNNKTKIKSGNNKLSSIEVSNGNINLLENVLEYSIEVEHDVEIFSISATPDDEKAKISGTGDYKLNVGLNEIKLVVTAEDNSTKEFIIKVTRKEKVHDNEFIVDNIMNQSKEEVSRDSDIYIIIMSIICLVIGFCIVYAIRKKLR